MVGLEVAGLGANKCQQKVTWTREKRDSDLNCSQPCGNQCENPTGCIVGIIIP